MSMTLIAFFLFAALTALVIAILLIDWGVQAYVKQRERRAMRVRDSEARKYCITPQFGTKDRHQGQRS